MSVSGAALTITRRTACHTTRDAATRDAATASHLHAVYARSFLFCSSVVVVHTLIRARYITQQKDH